LVREEEKDSDDDDSTGRCRVLWTAIEEEEEIDEDEELALTDAFGNTVEPDEEGIPVMGDYIEIDEEGNMGLYEVGGNGKPLWKRGCSRGNDSRVVMTVVRKKFEGARVVLLRSFTTRNNGRKTKKGRDWSVKRTGYEEVTDCL